MSIQRGINQLLYTTAIGANVYRKKIEAGRAEKAEKERISGLERTLTPKKNAAGRTITPRAKSAESEVNRAVLKELTAARKEAFLKNPTEENRAAFLQTQSDLNKLEQRRAMANAQAAEKIKAKVAQKEERRNFLQMLKGLPPEDQAEFKNLSKEDRAAFAQFIAGADAQEIVSRLPAGAQLQAFKQTKGE